MAQDKKAFDRDLREVFGERAAEFNETLRGLLFELWKRGQNPTRVPLSRHPVEIEDNPGAIPAVTTQSFAVSRPAPKGDCRDCGGTGMGDYPWECHACHGTGNVGRG